MKRHKCNGFAIVLVAALAGLIFLLGASLVVVTRLQSAAASYDQRVRLAREHARAALDIAIAELQDKLGRDISVSFAADALSSESALDFKDESRTGAVREPFWTGASSGSGAVDWLVTRKVGGATELPYGNVSGKEVKLLGKGTVGDRELLKVEVPVEAIKVSGVDGFNAADAKTIGNYGYWVGDLGVKASYARYDKVQSVDYEPYVIDPDPEMEDDEVSFAQDRIRQVAVAKPNFKEMQEREDGTLVWNDIVDTNDVSEDPGNTDRVDRFVNDFQFRDRFGGSADANNRYLAGLEQAETEFYFHDFTPLAKGLLVNSAEGGFRNDLTGNYAYDSKFKDFADLALESKGISLSSYDEGVFQIADGPISTLPYVTQFNLSYIVSVNASNLLEVGVEATVELWNPFSSAMDLADKEIFLRPSRLPHIEIIMVDSEGTLLHSLRVDLAVDSDGVPLKIQSFAGDSTVLRPGEVVVLSGPQLVEESLPAVPLLLGDGAFDSYTLFEGEDAVPSGITEITLSMVEDGDTGPITNYPLSVEYYLEGEGSESLSEPLNTYQTPSFTLDEQVFSGFPFRFGFSWKVNELSLMTREEYHPYDFNLSGTNLQQFESDATDSVNTSSDFSTGDSELLGERPSDAGGIVSEYDVPYILLPKQELGNVANFSASASSEATGRDYVSIGEALVRGENYNEYFDRYFFSTTPDGGSGWTFGDVVPNAAYVHKLGIDSFPTNPAEALFVHGMFNVHSTSIDAWEAILKGSPVSQHPYWREVLPPDTYLFMNHPLGGEDINILDPSDMPEIGEDVEPDDYPLEAKRASLKKNAFALTELEVKTLAELIVKEIREYVGSDPVNPFDSLEEFVNSGVLQNAIDELDADELLFINPSWVIPGTPAEFRQSTILNLISGILSVRSDTFLVRAYGDAVDPADPTNVWAKAYCEAIVQRTHEQYGDVVPDSATDKTALDRKFEVVAFRWLSPSEI